MDAVKRLSHAERRERIVDAAMQTFARTGFRGARSRDLAQSAGVSEALIYKFFPNKRALQKAIIEHRIRQSGGGLPPGLESSAPEEVLLLIARYVFVRVDRDPSFMRLLLFSSLEGEPLAPMFFLRHVARNIDDVAGCFRAWIKRGLVRKDLDAKLAAWTFVGTLYALMMDRHIFRVRRLEDRAGDLAQKVVDLFLKGLRS